MQRIAEAVKPFGLEYRQTAGVDMLVDATVPSAKRAVHLVFTGEKIRPEYEEPVPPMLTSRTVRGIRLVPLADLVRMKLTSFRLKDQTHPKDLDEAGLIAPEVEIGLNANNAATFACRSGC